jgi:hypothetical protein
MEPTQPTVSNVTKIASTIRSCVASINQIKLRSTSPLQHTTTTMSTGPLAKCTHCRPDLFPQEVSKAMWCCKKEHMPYAIGPANRRIQKCIGNFSDARQFRMHSRRRSLNLASVFICRIRNQVWRGQSVVCATLFHESQRYQSQLQGRGHSQGSLEGDSESGCRPVLLRLPIAGTLTATQPHREPGPEVLEASPVSLPTGLALSWPLQSR